MTTRSTCLPSPTPSQYEARNSINTQTTILMWTQTTILMWTQTTILMWTQQVNSVVQTLISGGKGGGLNVHVWVDIMALNHPYYANSQDMCAIRIVFRLKKTLKPPFSCCFLNFGKRPNCETHTLTTNHFLVWPLPLLKIYSERRFNLKIKYI